MHTESAYDGCTAYCYPEQGMVDRLLRVHIQSQQAFGPWLTLSYNTCVCTCRLQRAFGSGRLLSYNSCDQVMFALCVVPVAVATRLCLFDPRFEWQWKLRLGCARGALYVRIGLVVVFSVSHRFEVCCAFAFLGSARHLSLSPCNTMNAKYIWPQHLACNAPSHLICRVLLV